MFREQDASVCLYTTVGSMQYHQYIISVVWCCGVLWLSGRMRDLQSRENPGSNPVLEVFGHFRSLHDAPVHSAVQRVDNAGQLFRLNSF